MPCYKLYYFNGRGRAETARMLFALAGVAYEDKRLNSEQWKEFKPTTPNGQMPLLEIDGVLYPQSNAIDEYVAEVGNLNGKNAMDRFKINIFRDDIIDVIKPVQVPGLEGEAKKKAEAVAYDEKLPVFLERLEKHLKESGNKFYIGEVSRADVFLITFSDFVLPNRPNAFDNYPNVQALLQRTKDLENLKKYLESRPKTNF